MRSLLVLLVALLVFTPARAAYPTPEAADAVAAAALKAFRVPGAAVVVVRGDQVLVLKGYGRRSFDANAPVTPDTVFPLASCTKQFTSALLAMLVDDDALGWDDPVKKHLPGFRLSDPNADALLTLRDLLAHRTGLASHDLLWYRAPWTIDHALKQVTISPSQASRQLMCKYASKDIDKARAVKPGDRRVRDLDLRFTRSCR